MKETFASGVEQRCGGKIRFFCKKLNAHYESLCRTTWKQNVFDLIFQKQLHLKSAPRFSLSFSKLDRVMHRGFKHEPPSVKVWLPSVSTRNNRPVQSRHRLRANVCETPGPGLCFGAEHTKCWQLFAEVPQCHGASLPSETNSGSSVVPGEWQRRQRVVMLTANMFVPCGWQGDNERARWSPPPPPPSIRHTNTFHRDKATT